MEQNFLKTGAAFSNCRNYRYALWRIWHYEKPPVMFIGLNPSIADEVRGDRTLARCISYAEDWHYGGVYIGNLFAWCSTDPNNLSRVEDPIGPENKKWLLKKAKKVDMVVVAWGNHGDFMNQNQEVLKLFASAYCIGTTKQGHPRHPLYLRKNIKPIKFC